MKNTFFLAGAFLLLLAACKKDDDTSKNYVVSGPYGNMDDAYASAVQKPTTASVSVSSGGSVRSISGTRFIIPANAFIDASGNPVTGSVDVVVNDWLHRGDMVFSKMLPTTATEPLESGGQAMIKVTQGGKDVFLKPGMQVQMNLPQFGKAVAGMQFFAGDPTPAGAANNVTWRGVDTTRRAWAIYNGADTISLFSDSVGYANADRFLTNPNYQDYHVKFTMADGSSAGTVYGYTFFDGQKTIWPLFSPVSGTFHEEHVPDIPVHMIIVTLQNGYFYAGTLAATPKTGQTYTVTLQKTDPNAFRAQMNALP